MEAVTYARILTGAELPTPVWDAPEQAQVHELLTGRAAEFAAACRATPNQRFPRDSMRRATLLYGRGLGVDEASAFLRATEAGLVIVEPDGHFLVPSARACSANLHLVGRNEDHVVLHTEVLVHVGAFAELVLDLGWDTSQLVFDPFMRGAALDLWGYADPPAHGRPWSEGRIVFAAEAKARTTGSDSLSSLVVSFQRLENDPDAAIGSGHRRKWDELARIVGEHGPIELLLVADGARWWYDVAAAPRGIRLTARDSH